MATATESPIDAVLVKLDGPRASGPGAWSARCPAHEDRSPSLSIAVGDDGRVLLHCHAGCDTGNIVRALGLTERDLFTRKASTPTDSEVTYYRYLDEDGIELFQVVRKPGKQFLQRHRDGGAWVWNTRGVRRVPYRLPEVIAAAAAGKTIYIVEGERDADALVRLGQVATCNPGGAGKWSTVAADAARVLAGADVVVVADRDDPGYRHADDVRRSLEPVARSVKVLQPAVGKDVSDHLVTHGLGIDDLEPVATDADRAGADENAAPALIDPSTGEPVPEEIAGRVWMELDRIDAREIATRIRAERDYVALPGLVSLRTAIDEAPEVQPSRVERVMPANGRTIIVAPQKAGKTTVTINVIRAIASGGMLFDRWRARRGRVAVLNYEVLGEQFASWCQDAAVPLDDVTVMSLRGRANPLATTRGRKDLASLLADAGVDVLVVDPFGRASRGIVENENSNSDVRAFTGILDELVDAGGVSELLMPVHAGWGAEHARGASELQDWPDAIWTLAVDENGNRFFRATGRDVEFGEDLLQFNPQNRRLSFTARTTNRLNAAYAQAADLIVEIVETDPGMNVSEIEQALDDAGTTPRKGEASKWLKALESERRIVRVRDGKSRRHYLPGQEPTHVA